MKASSATSAAARSPSPPARGRRSPATSRLSPTDGFVLAGPSRLPDPTVAAYRRDLADVALAGQVITSHYAEPLPRAIVRPAALQEAPDGAVIGELAVGEPLAMLDCTGGWAWGYAGRDRRVGYVRVEAVGPADPQKQAGRSS